jgi:biopolymer transport protein ExbD
MRIEFARLTRCLVVMTLLLASVAGSADAPVPIDVLRTGEYVMNGIVYKTRSELAAALRQLKPKALRIQPDPDAPYESVEEALRAVQDSGIQADLGFVGNGEKK